MKASITDHVWKEMYGYQTQVNIQERGGHWKVCSWQIKSVEREFDEIRIAGSIAEITISFDMGKGTRKNLSKRKDVSSNFPESYSCGVLTLNSLWWILPQEVGEKAWGNSRIDCSKLSNSLPRAGQSFVCGVRQALNMFMKVLREHFQSSIRSRGTHSKIGLVPHESLVLVVGGAVKY